jgi:hypothetical protein
VIVEHIEFYIPQQDLVDILRDLPLEGLQYHVRRIILKTLLLESQITGTLQSAIAALNNVRVSQFQSLVDFGLISAHNILVSHTCSFIGREEESEFHGSVWRESFGNFVGRKLFDSNESTKRGFYVLFGGV